MGAARRMCAVVGAALTLVWAGGAAARTVELATLTWPPFYGPDLPEGGPVTALVRAALNTQGHRLEMHWVPWPRAKTMARAGQVDGLLGAYRNAKRQRHFRFSDPIMTVRGGFIGSKALDIRRYDSLRALESYRIGTLQGGDYPRRFKRAGFLDIDPEPRNERNIRKLVHARIDLAAMAFQVFRHHAREMDGVDPDQFVALQPPLWERELFVAISQQIDGTAAIARAVNAGLRQLEADGRREIVLRRHGVERATRPDLSSLTGGNQTSAAGSTP